MTMFDVRCRVRNAEQFGWKLEDLRFTPGCPVFAIRRPDGTEGAVLGNLHLEEQADSVNKILDEIGVPP